MPLSIKISELTLRLEEFSVSPKSTLIILGRCHSGRLTTTLRWMESRYNTSEYPHHTNFSHGPFIAYSVKGLTVVRTYAYELFGLDNFSDRGIAFYKPFSVYLAYKYIVVIDDSTLAPGLEDYIISAYNDSCDIITVVRDETLASGFLLAPGLEDYIISAYDDLCDTITVVGDEILVSDFAYSNDAKDISKEREERIKDAMDGKSFGYSLARLQVLYGLLKLEQKETFAGGNLSYNEVSDSLINVLSTRCAIEDVKSMISLLLSCANRISHNSMLKNEYIETLIRAKQYAVLLEDQQVLDDVNRIIDKYLSKKDSLEFLFAGCFDVCISESLKNKLIK